jgi:methyl coenzyme M reductase beta subunit
MLADKPWLYFQNLFQEEKKLPEKNITANTGKAVKFHFFVRERTCY